MRYRVIWDVDVEGDSPHLAASNAEELWAAADKSVRVEDPGDDSRYWIVEVTPWKGPEGVVSRVVSVAEYRQ